MTADDAAREAVQGLAAAYRRDGMEDAALAVESLLARRREQRPDVTQREAVAGYLSSRNWGNRHTRMGGPRGFWLAEADALLAALSAIAPTQPDPLNFQSGSNLEFAGGSQPDPLRAGVQALADEWNWHGDHDDERPGWVHVAARLRELLAETEVRRGE